MHTPRTQVLMTAIGRVWLLSVSFGLTILGQPIQVHPSNPHYLMFKGAPIILITSAEHYGAVLNKEFDYVAYFEALHAHGLNYTRIYPGALFEPMGKFMTGNTLAPRPRSLILPWARSATPGYLVGGNKFDLDRWDPEYFARLKDFIAQAAKRNIIVEICMFNSQYSDTWPLSALYYENNVQGVGNCDWRDAQTLRDADLVRREDDYVRKITQEVNAFDNVVLEICDEAAGIGTGVDLAGPWVGHMVDTVRNAEQSLPKKHLIAQEVEGRFGGPMDFSADPRVSMIVAQYLWGRDTGEMGGMRALNFKYDNNKPIELNETDYYPRGYRGDRIGDSRAEAWEFIVGGGAAFNQLNGLFTADNPAGKGAENDRLLQGLENLSRFINSFDFLKMHPDKSFVIDGMPAQAYYRVISEPGKQYAMYAHHSGPLAGGSYTVVPGNYQEKLTVRLPAGRYRAEWIDPALGSVTSSETFAHEGGTRTLSTPAYTVDIALRVKRSS